MLTTMEVKAISADDVHNITGIKDADFSTKAISGKTFIELHDRNGKTSGYVFDTVDFVHDVKGFKGPIRLLVYISSDGILKNFQIIKSSDYAKYLNKVMKKKNQYLNKDISQPGIAATDAVTGATYSSRGIAKTLEKAGIAFTKLIELKQE